MIEALTARLCEYAVGAAGLGVSFGYVQASVPMVAGFAGCIPAMVAARWYVGAV